MPPELAKRVSISGSETALQQGITRLRARLLKLEERLAKLENSALQQVASQDGAKPCSRAREGGMPGSLGTGKAVFPHADSLPQSGQG